MPTYFPVTDGPSTSTSTHVCSPNKHVHTPLAAMLPPEYADKDVREWFPEFKTGEVTMERLMFYTSLVYRIRIYWRIITFLGFAILSHL